MEGLTKMGCTHGAPSNASLELGPPFWRCAMVGVHPRRPVQRRPGTRTNHLWCGVIYTNPKKKMEKKGTFGDHHIITSIQVYAFTQF